MTKTSAYHLTSEQELEAFPVGAVRRWQLSGVLLFARKEANGCWTVMERQGVPMWTLARAKSAEITDADQREVTASAAEHVEAVKRMAAASGR